MGITQERLYDLINKRKLSLITLSIATGIEINEIEKFLTGKSVSLLPNEEHYLIEITMMLTDGMEIVTNDDRIKAIIDILREVYKMDYSMLSLYVGGSEQLVEDFMENASSISADKKYNLAVRIFMLHYIFKFPDYNKVPK